LRQVCCSHYSSFDSLSLFSGWKSHSIRPSHLFAWSATHESKYPVPC
jgi:hypothetical protein